MVAPQLHVGVRAVGESGKLVQRCAVALDGDHGAGREVGGDAHHGGWVDPGVGDGRRHSPAEHVAVVVGHLQGPFARKPDAGDASRVLAGDHGMRVFKYPAAQFLAVPDPDDDGPPGKRAVVHAYDKVFGSVH
ncbi:hypothetical protein SRABI128_05784 [Microbacterium sp. Bi128]|nr:hypothetical protein SRABI128_05784 [Microbacterium sp. Bi128]